MVGPSRGAADAARSARVAVENINHPGKSRLVDAAKYRAMRRAILTILPRRAPGRTLADASVAVLPHLPATLFPSGAHAGWWLKTVQLDLEAKALIARERTTPLLAGVPSERDLFFGDGDRVGIDDGLVFPNAAAHWPSAGEEHAGLRPSRPGSRRILSDEGDSDPPACSGQGGTAILCGPATRY
jgi:hypothetical protein